MSTLPRAELDTLLLTVSKAVELAEEGKAADGYQALLAGLRRAEEARDDGEAWGEELVRRWQAALDRYAQRHGIGRA